MNFKDNLLEYLSENETVSLLDSLNEVDKHAVLLNLEKMNDETFLNLYPNCTKHPIVPHAYLYNKDEYELGKSIYYDLGCFYIQEPSAMLVSCYLNPVPGDIVLDMCAAPGGKSMQAAMLLKDKGVIISNDLSSSRIGAVRENAERMGLGNLLIVNSDFSKIYKNYLNYFDKIILDAPCSGSGMFRKDDDVKEDWTYEKVLKFQGIQKELIDIAYQMLKPGGTMIYSTCSFSKEEDEDVIEHLCSLYQCEILPLEDKLFYNGKYGVHLFPFLFPGEGHYMCLIKKPGILSQTETKNKKNSQFDKFINLNSFSHTNIVKFGDYLFSLPFEVKTKGLNIVRYGLKIGEISGSILKYDYHFSHYIKEFYNECEINDEQIVKYFNGESFEKESHQGFILVKYQNINVDIAKSVSNTIKNKLPKGLRRHF